VIMLPERRGQIDRQMDRWHIVASPRSA